MARRGRKNKASGKAGPKGVKVISPLDNIASMPFLCKANIDLPASIRVGSGIQSTSAHAYEYEEATPVLTQPDHYSAGGEILVPVVAAKAGRSYLFPSNRNCETESHAREATYSEVQDRAAIAGHSLPKFNSELERGKAVN